jgi:hypothetical protein
VSFISIKLVHSNIINYNIFSLIEALLITWQFKNWKLFNKLSFLLILTGLVITWAIEVFFISSIHVFASYFIIIYSFIIVLMSISILNMLIIKEQGHLLKNSIFLICISFIVYFTYAVIVEIFLLYGINESEKFMINVYAILVYINLFVNLLFALAILWMPTRQIFTTPF